MVVCIHHINNLINMLQSSLNHLNAVLDVFKNTVFGNNTHCKFSNNIDCSIRKIFMQDICTKGYL